MTATLSGCICSQCKSLVDSGTLSVDDADETLEGELPDEQFW
jgi:hypothetical protein